MILVPLEKGDYCSISGVHSISNSWKEVSLFVQPFVFNHSSRKKYSTGIVSSLCPFLVFKYPSNYSFGSLGQVTRFIESPLFSITPTKAGIILKAKALVS